MIHRWDDIRATPTTWDKPLSGHGIHESVFRSYQTLQVVKHMLDHGDSQETIRDFIRWVEAEPVTPAA